MNRVSRYQTVDGIIGSIDYDFLTTLHSGYQLEQGSEVFSYSDSYSHRGTIEDESFNTATVSQTKTYVYDARGVLTRSGGDDSCGYSVGGILTHKNQVPLNEKRLNINGSS